MKNYQGKFHKHFGRSRSLFGPDYFSNHSSDYKMGARLSINAQGACKLQPWHDTISFPSIWKYPENRKESMNKESSAGLHYFITILQYVWEVSCHDMSYHFDRISQSVPEQMFVSAYSMSGSVLDQNEVDRPEASGWSRSTNNVSCESWGGWSQYSGYGIGREGRDMRDWVLE